MITGKWFLGSEGLADAYMLRRRVFIEEQGVPEHIEMDGSDSDAFVLVIYDANLPVATGRIKIIGGDFVLGRIAVLPECRGRGYGDFLMRVLIRKAFEMGADTQFVHSQLQAQGFYEKYGFTAYGEMDMEAGIPHIHMMRTGDIGGDCL